MLRVETTGIQNFHQILLIGQICVEGCQKSIVTVKIVSWCLWPEAKKMFYWLCWLTEEIGTWSEIHVKIESFMGMDWLWDAEGAQRRCTVKNWAWVEVLDPYSRKGLWNISLPKCANTYKVRREKWWSEGVWGENGSESLEEKMW